MTITKIFCDVDDFCTAFMPEFEKQLLQSGQRQRKRNGRLSLSEIMTIIIYFHVSRYRDFKNYYKNFVCTYLKPAFPDVVSYNRFVELMPTALMALCAYLNTRKGQNTGIAFVDSTSIAVCHNRRIRSHKVFKNLAKRGKTSTGWFYGFKLHLIINDQGELIAFKLTAGNADDRKAVPEMAKGLSGKLFGDKGYISKELFEELIQKGLHLITKIKKKMKNRLMLLFDKILLRKRSLIETVNDQLKNISQIEHSRHRSPCNFIVNLVAGLIAYTYQEKKPSLKISENDLDLRFNSNDFHPLLS